MKILGGTSRVSVLALRKALEEKVNNLSANDAAQFSNDLFTILTVLSSSVGMRRALTDNARDTAAKAELISTYLAKISRQMPNQSWLPQRLFVGHHHQS